MGIDYLIPLDCAPKRELGERIVELVKVRSRARAVRRLHEEGRGGEGVQVVRRGPDGEERQERLSVADLERAAEPLGAYAHHCGECPANLLDDAYGCFGAVSYPLSARAESWLVERLPERVDVPPGSLLLQAVERFPLTGAVGQQMRQQGLLEAEQAVGARWGDVGITSEQLLEYLFRAEHGPPTCRLTLLLLGAVERPEDPGAVGAMIRGEETLPAWTLPEEPEADPSVVELATFLRTVHRAAELGVGLLAEP